MDKKTPKSYQNLIKHFLKFPTVGPKTAARFVSFLIHQPKEKVKKLINSIQDLKQKIKLCSFCFNPFEPQNDQASLCFVCEDKRRDKKTLCVVEKEIDLLTIEETNKYKGLYFVLGGTVSKLRKKDIKKLRIEELIQRIKNPKKFGVAEAEIKEVIIATNPTTEGESTASLIESKIKKLPSSPKITHLARGLPKGGELEYADEETLGAAFEGRK